jgi:hypothetical protein
LTMKTTAQVSPPWKKTVLSSLKMKSPHLSMSHSQRQTQSQATRASPRLAASFLRCSILPSPSQTMFLAP